jgi:hypothetical protein
MAGTMASLNAAHAAAAKAKTAQNLSHMRQAEAKARLIAGSSVAHAAAGTALDVGAAIARHVPRPAPPGVAVAATAAASGGDPPPSPSNRPTSSRQT